MQTKKIIEEREEEDTGKKFSRISSIICQAFTFIDNDSATSFNSLDKLVNIAGKIEKIDFDKPKAKWGEKFVE